MSDNAEINFDAPATLRKWPSLNNERVNASLGGVVVVKSAKDGV